MAILFWANNSFKRVMKIKLSLICIHGCPWMHLFKTQDTAYIVYASFGWFYIRQQISDYRSCMQPASICDGCYYFRSQYSIWDLIMKFRLNRFSTTVGLWLSSELFGFHFSNRPLSVRQVISPRHTAPKKSTTELKYRSLKFVPLNARSQLELLKNRSVCLSLGCKAYQCVQEWDTVYTLSFYWMCWWKYF